MECYHNWNDQTRLRYDTCARKQFDLESRGTGKYQISNPAIRDCVNREQYKGSLCQPIHQQKQWWNACNVDVESGFRYNELTDKRYIDQLFTRPYLGAYMGAGKNSFDKDTETDLIYGHNTRSDPRRACDVLSGVSIDRFWALPEYGNPQRVQHIIPTAWVRGGEHTRDFVRRVDYERRCLNKKNNCAGVH